MKASSKRALPILRNIVTVLALSAIAAALPTGCANAEPENIALGCKVEFDPAPNYGGCSDPNDAVQLTDGQYMSGVIWAETGTVGWNYKFPIIEIDLGSVQPVGGISFSTAAGQSGVGWPKSLMIYASTDRKNWQALGDLVTLDRKENGPITGSGLTLHKYTTHTLRANARYIKIAVMPGYCYAFCDEIEVYRGSLPAAPVSGGAVTDVRKEMRSASINIGITTRLENDIRDARAAVASSKLDTSRKADLNRRLDNAERSIPSLPDVDPDTFKAILPLNNVHSQIYSVYAPIMRSNGLNGLFTWTKHRFDYLTPTEAPTAKPGRTVLNVTMMQNERRAESLLLTNATDKAIQGTIRIEGADAKWLKIIPVTWTDTKNGMVIADALPEPTYKNGAVTLKIPSGMTRKVWLLVDSSKLDAGVHSADLKIGGYTKPLIVPLTVRVSPVKMQRPRLSLGMWDYTDGTGGFDLNPGNRDACIRLMNEGLLDSPWAQPQSLPQPAEADYDANNRLNRELDYSILDAWVKLWPNAKNYMIFANLPSTFAGAQISDPAFSVRAGEWAKALTNHIKSLGLKPEQFHLLLVDEPYTDAQDDTIAAWARAIKASAPELVLYEDPIWKNPQLNRNQDAIKLVDVICPNLLIFYQGDQGTIDYYKNLKSDGHKLWFYQCDTSMKTLDPHRYLRLMAWYAFKYGAEGIGFWSFCDNASFRSSWNEYDLGFSACTPVFLDRKSATDSIHWQAIRESLQDNEYLSMLKDAAGQSSSSEFKTKAEQLFQEIDRQMLPAHTGGYTWSAQADRQLPDYYRLKVLSLLESIK